MGFPRESRAARHLSPNTRLEPAARISFAREGPSCEARVGSAVDDLPGRRALSIRPWANLESIHPNATTRPFDAARGPLRSRKANGDRTAAETCPLGRFTEAESLVPP
mgnify:CR=1 FL=1